jgi:glycine/D-amino acid oxidase-like deaminating enzyme
MSGSPDGIYESGVVDPGIPVANSTQPFWHSQPSPIHQVRSQWTDTADVVIIGSGMTGMSIARTLYSKRPKLKIVMIEAREICSGATGRNGGHIKVMSYNVWFDRKRRFGIEEAIRWTEFEHAHLAEIVACVRDNEVDCDLEVQEGVDAYFDTETFRRAVHAIQDMKAHAPELASQYVIYSASEAAVRFQCADSCIGAIGIPSAAVWPYKLVTFLIEKMMQEEGLSVQTNTKALSVIDVDGAKYGTVVTDRGSIHATHIIHATNGWIGHLNPELRPFISPVRGNVVRHTPLPSTLRLGNTFWMRYTEKDYDYLIQRPAGDFIIGRANLGRKATGDDSSVDFHAQAHLRGILPQLLNVEGYSTKVTHAWGGILGFTQDGNPFVGRFPAFGKSHQWVCGGYHGIGMIKAFKTGQMLAMLVLGEEVPLQYPRTMLINDKRMWELESSLAIKSKL